LLVTRQEGAVTLVASTNVKALARDYVAEGWDAADPRATRLLASGRQSFLSEADLFSRVETEREPLFDKFLRPRGFGGFLGAGCLLPGGRSVVLTFESEERSGPLTEEALRVLNALHPHLSRVLRMIGQAEISSLQARVATLSLLGLPAAVLSPQRAVIASNELFEPYLPDARGSRIGRQSFTRRGADDRVFLALERFLNRSGGCPEATPIAGRHGRSPLLLHAMALPRADENPFTLPASLVVVASVSRGPVPSVGIIQQLFDLTPAEARVAHGIGAGETVDELAARSNVSPAAIRFHLKSVFAKIGLLRQADLVALLGGCTAIRSTPPGDTARQLAPKAPTASVSRQRGPAKSKGTRRRETGEGEARARSGFRLGVPEEGMRE